ncbi:unnamed protein product [Danaus chrysippus]|uniref:(African queen) hypothetical protein n=1 Tax=Danaus chrysippus TaxID=151541 RepID=A0A8J2VSP0_9NEOP|nr:unnamed protein product [Danaus chrysippus]
MQGGPRPGDYTPPPPPGRAGSSLARAFTLARCSVAPQVTKFRELRDFYGCPKVDLRVGISGLVRPVIILPGTS